MTIDESFLSNEQLRYIRRSGQCKLTKPSDIFPMIDLIVRIKNRPGMQSSWFERENHKKYEHDIHYILSYFPHLEVHQYLAAIDPQFMKRLYKNLEGLEYYDVSDRHNRKVYERYQKIKDFIPLVMSQIALTI